MVVFHFLSIFLGRRVTSTSWTLQASISFHFPLKYSNLSLINIIGNNSCKNPTFVKEIVKAPKLSNWSKSPKIRKNTEMKIVMKAIKEASIEPEKISQSLLVVLRILSKNSLLSILLDPIFSAAENLALQI